MQYLGDYPEDYATLNFKFSTHKADGTPITLAGSPAVKVYKANATDSETTTGVTLTVGFDSVTGLHNVLIDLSADAFYAVGNDYSVVITAGTVDSISVVGTVLAHFSIENRNIKADLVSILGTALTETAGYLAAAFKKFFNIETPVGTINKIPATLAAADVSGNVPVDVSAIQTGLATATNVSDAKDEIIAAIDEIPGGSAPTVEQIRAEMDTNSIKLAAILEDTGTTLPALINADSGAGAISYPYTLTDADDHNPIDGALVWVTTDAAGANRVASGYTNSMGIVTFMLDAGTHYFWRKRAGYNFVNPDIEIVEA